MEISSRESQVVGDDKEKSTASPAAETPTEVPNEAKSEISEESELVIPFPYIGLPELTDEQINNHVFRIASGDFPWDKLNILIVKGHGSGEIPENEVKNWEFLHGMYLSREKRLKEFKMDFMEAKRFDLNAVLLWGLAVACRWGFPKYDGKFSRLNHSPDNILPWA